MSLKTEDLCRDKNAPPTLWVRAADFDVLSHEVQAELLSAVRSGRLARQELQRTADLGDRQRLEADIQLGDRAVRLLVCSNLRLVIWCAARCGNRWRHLDRDDLIQEGVRGLLRAIEKFDPAFGSKLSTYAMWWIRQSIARAGMTSGTVRIPVHVQNGTYGGRDAQELAHRFDDLLSVERLLRDAADVEAEPASLDAGLSWSDRSSGWREPAMPDDSQDQVDARIIADTVLAQLSPREAMVLRRRAGYGGVEETLEQIGADLHVTRERVRQIEAVALEKSRRLLTLAA